MVMPQRTPVSSEPSGVLPKIYFLSNGSWVKRISKFKLNISVYSNASAEIFMHPLAKAVQIFLGKVYVLSIKFRLVDFQVSVALPQNGVKGYFLPIEKALLDKLGKETTLSIQ